MNRRGQDRTGPLGGSGLIAQWGAPSMIRSVQYISGTVTGASTALTITAVSPENSIAIANGDSTTYAGISIGAWTYGARVTAATTVTVTRGNWVGETAEICVIEFAPGVIRSIQTGAMTIGLGSTAQTAAVTTVNTAKALLLWQPYSGGDTISTNDVIGVRATLTNSTTITATRYASSASYTSSGIYQLVEFF
jgi:hypothetical protein